MDYYAQPDPYADPKTGALINKLGIKDPDELERVEANYSTTEIQFLTEAPVAGALDLFHLQKVHRRLFSKIYAWAGELRTVDIAKDNTRFTPPEFIQKWGEEKFAELRKELVDAHPPKLEYLARLAHHYSEINLIHPFREGNGRTERAFFTLLGMSQGYEFDWTRMDPGKNIEACNAAYFGDETKLAGLLGDLIIWT